MRDNKSVAGSKFSRKKTRADPSDFARLRDSKEKTSESDPADESAESIGVASKRLANLDIDEALVDEELARYESALLNKSKNRAFEAQSIFSKNPNADTKSHRSKR
jgi:hypothetical protein